MTTIHWLIGWVWGALRTLIQFFGSCLPSNVQSDDDLLSSMESGSLECETPLLGNDDFQDPSAFQELPPGWERCIDVKRARVYYVNHIDEMTTWLHPTHYYHAKYYHPNLPSGWEVHVDSKGRKYYRNNSDNTTT
ncbi:hypothetical protein C8R43DRAFT_942783 [Mycena crocata]|nr:hypothetical protein C8R43DRAFT_966137 [Mycena crocata]KAJ7177510.1 hypothetical protein C8R43DRAFT_942783 [Mycena crocata]